MENLPAYIRQSLEAYAKRIYDLTEERDEALAEAARLREAIEQHREDVAVFEGSEEDDAWSWHQALWAVLDGEEVDR